MGTGSTVVVPVLHCSNRLCGIVCSMWWSFQEGCVLREELFLMWLIMAITRTSHMYCGSRWSQCQVLVWSPQGLICALCCDTYMYMYKTGFAQTSGFVVNNATTAI